MKPHPVLGPAAMVPRNSPHSAPADAPLSDRATRQWIRTLRDLIVLVIAWLLVVPAPIAKAEVTQEQLLEARAEMNARAAELDTQLDELEEILLVQTGYETRIAQLQDQISARDREIALSALAAREQARAMYVNAGSAGSLQSAGFEETTEFGTKNAYLGIVVNSNTDAANRLSFLRQDLSLLQDQLKGLVAQQKDLADQASVLSDEMLEALSSADAEYQALYSQWREEEAERERQRRLAAQREAAAAAAASAVSAAPTATTNVGGNPFVDPTGRTCPVAGANTFRDSWLEPRDYRGGLHHGTDMIAAAGTPEVAIETGNIWSMGYHWAGGNGLYIKGDSGDIYYYAHMQGYAPGIAVGTRVTVGQVVGYVGSTGAASVPHLHVGYQPGGGPLVNPYPLLVELCR